MRLSEAVCGSERQKHAKSCYRSGDTGARQLERVRVQQSAAECSRVRQSAADCGRTFERLLQIEDTAESGRNMRRAVTDQIGGTATRVRQSAAECGRVRQSAAECDGLRQSAAEHSKGCYRSGTRPRAVETCEELLQIRSGARQLECGRVRQSAAECGRVRQSAAECDGVRRSAKERGTVQRSMRNLLHIGGKANRNHNQKPGAYGGAAAV